MRRARKRASAARRAWKQARRTRPAKTRSARAGSALQVRKTARSKPVAKATVRAARKTAAASRAGTTRTKTVRRVVKAVVKAVAKTVAGKAAAKRPTLKRRAAPKKVVAPVVAPRRPRTRPHKAPLHVQVVPVATVTPAADLVEAAVTPTAYDQQYLKPPSGLPRASPAPVPVRIPSWPETPGRDDVWQGPPSALRD